VTGRDADRFAFKVPSLRNILKTGPYLHDGSIATIEEMIKVMAEYQLGKNLTDQEIANMVAFFGALTGDLPLAYIAKPELPANGPETPGPYEYDN
jgi:cytochrome c peroxidase